MRRLRRRTRPVHVDLASEGGTIALAVADEVSKAEVGCRRRRRRGEAWRGATPKLRLHARVVSDLFTALPSRLRGRVDVITLHPPYVPVDEIEDLPEEIREWEPPTSPTGAPMGWGSSAARSASRPAWLRAGGWLLVEVSPDRASEVKRLFASGGSAT